MKEDNKFGRLIVQSPLFLVSRFVEEMLANRSGDPEPSAFGPLSPAMRRQLGKIRKGPVRVLSGVRRLLAR